jgi:hypothetical protein
MKAERKIVFGKMGARPTYFVAVAVAFVAAGELVFPIAVGALVRIPRP